MINGIFQITLYLGVLLALTRPLGIYMRRVYEGDLPVFVRWLQPAENLLYHVCGIDRQEMRWTRYALAMLWFSLLGVLAVYLLQRLQGMLPLNPQGMGAVTPDSSFNTALSFVTNTNWQGYVGESTMSYFTQMAGLTVQNFFSAATGMAVAIALIRGFARHTVETIGNFWVDMTRSTLYILLPLSVILALVLVGQGVIQNLSAYQAVITVDATTYDNPRVDAAGPPLKDAAGNPVTEKIATHEQVIAMGPVASQEAIKQLGTNGGGFFNANSAHPFENPTPLANFLSMLAIFLIPAALCYTFGSMVGDTRQGWAILISMTLLFVGFLAVAEYAELNGNPAFNALGVDQSISATQSGGNMEGKETRFGIVNSALFATITTAASCGAVNAMHDSLTPLGGLVPMAQIQLGEVIFGGVGSGLYGMLVYAVIAVFLAGLMIGRTPEYLGKKIEAYDIKMASLVILIPPLIILGGTALAVMLEAGKNSIFNPGAHGFSEVLYAFSSAVGNNGSAFAGISANTPFYNSALGFAVWFGRFWLIIPVLALAGSLAAKKRIPASVGSMATHTPLFVWLLISTVLLVGALNFVPALALGPVIEHLNMIGVH
ncbi:potassium-transporting ATPase potassium-binding subunit [Sideroxyarcus emersonii]|uniref:Potassium-transporting ATPase potassium-binding subunit n=1 Tax=Sideroxyarcus emersonii TaxID=2764705 RepID=A0AAN1XBF1_9PROT|nr:potassium-transporting ATPase subunit KdpA [Sideroxyarcus emersonii]BCK88320.1 potassium-transporting ATPase potassium-binding subunit [Sideroxyarcus emersonii]